MTENDFVLTITKIKPDIAKKKNSSSNKRPKPIPKRKQPTTEATHLIYKFNTFDDYCYFIEYLVKTNFTISYKIAEKIYLYKYKEFYYLVLCDINSKFKHLTRFFTVITEYGSYVINPDIFVHKLYESGMLFIRNNAFKKSFIHYIEK